MTMEQSGQDAVWLAAPGLVLRRPENVIGGSHEADTPF